MKRYRYETPLGHQPHMIVHEVDFIIEQAAKQNVTITYNEGE